MDAPLGPADDGELIVIAEIDSRELVLFGLVVALPPQHVLAKAVDVPFVKALALNCRNRTCLDCHCSGSAAGLQLVSDYAAIAIRSLMRTSIKLLLTLVLSESDDITVPRRSFARLAAKRPAGSRCRLRFHESMLNL